METKEDKISDLPGDVMDQILSFMPIKDAVKTCVLSIKWRYKWETVPINKFVLSGMVSLPRGEIDKLIRHVSKQSLQDFTLEELNDEVYHVPSCVFSCQNLTRLVLAKCCLLRPPSTFKGFKNLKTLDIRDVSVAQDVLECLISGSDVLSTLTLRGLHMKQFNINAPNLQFLYLEGNFVYISLKCKNLSDLFMNIYGFRSKHSNLVKLMAEIPHIRRLAIMNNSIEYLRRGDIPRELLQPCLNLYSLTINVSLTDSIETSVLFCLLRSAPNLRELVCNCWGNSNDDNYGEPGPFILPLERVEINNCRGLKAEMDFIKFLLLNAPNLERAAFKIYKILGKQIVGDIVTQLCSFNLVSPLAEVHISYA